MVRVHFREIARPPFDLFQHIAIAQRVYGKYGVYFCAASMTSIHVSAAEHAQLAAVGVGRGQGSSQWAQLFARYGVQDFSSITAFIVRSLVRLPGQSSLYGTSNDEPHRPSVVIGADACDWVLAHEVGHVLLGAAVPGHSRGHNELMREGPSHTTTETDPVFNEQQVEAIRSCRYALPC